MAARACIFGCEGLQLSSEEVGFFRKADPWGFILFARNVENPDQLRALTSDLRAAVGRDAPILVDQEGGRVARMRAPHWREWTPPLKFVAQAGPENAGNAMRLRYRLIAHELLSVGIDVNCAPMLDIAQDISHPIIRNRCYGSDPETVARMGRAAAEAMLSGGVLPIIKHIPGHGRASLDTHHDLPVLDTPLNTLQTSDFAPFAALADLPMAMTAHIVYSAIDPENCATLSKPVISVIRSSIGFDGLLMTDDLSMKALKGGFADRAETALAAGCDLILHCNGNRAEMDAILAAVPRLTGKGQIRADKALAARVSPADFDADAADAALAGLLKEVANV
ncbi:MAG: beta-N-acetylhexosaminidase [Rhodobacteraceae bacterium]|nr:beta-N-acetylhexosaminidase [Paracoccaceae bacterium]